MTVFDSPLSKKVKYRIVAPWKRKQKGLQKQNFSDDGEHWNRENCNEESGELHDTWNRRKQDEGEACSEKSVMGRIRVYSLFGAPLSIIVWIVLVAGVFVMISGCPVKFGHKVRPLINDSMWQSFLVGIAGVVTALVLGYITITVLSNVDKLFKNVIVRSELRKCFSVVYLETDDTAFKEDLMEKFSEAGKTGIEQLVSYLDIRNGQWNQMDYNDFFKVKYQEIPIYFCDITLNMEEKCGKYENSFLRFMGQILIMPIQVPCSPRSWNDYVASENGMASKWNDSSSPYRKLNWLKYGSEELKSSIDVLFSDKEKQHISDEEPLMIDDWGNKYASVFYEVKKIAECDVGVVVVGSYMVLILENNYDPFEFTFGDIFRTNKYKKNQVAQQVAWLHRIIMQLVDGGVV